MTTCRDSEVEVVARLLVEDWLAEAKIKIPGYVISKDDGIWSQAMSTARKYIDRVAPLIAAKAYEDAASAASGGLVPVGMLLSRAASLRKEAEACG